MAILNGILKKLNGSAGSLTFKQVNGQTVIHMQNIWKVESTAYLTLTLQMPVELLPML